MRLHNRNDKRDVYLSSVEMQTLIRQCFDNVSWTHTSLSLGSMLCGFMFCFCLNLPWRHIIIFGQPWSWFDNWVDVFRILLSLLKYLTCRRLSNIYCTMKYRAWRKLGLFYTCRNTLWPISKRKSTQFCLTTIRICRRYSILGYFF